MHHTLTHNYFLRRCTSYPRSAYSVFLTNYSRMRRPYAHAHTSQHGHEECKGDAYVGNAANALITPGEAARDKKTTSLDSFGCTFGLHFYVENVKCALLDRRA
ncbi:hypothetical protein EVAR_43798_1 [Eumeta japonica]|uniref:Uncharacterized protein n=1 Tax=Eumeta variegata TaxID=151549 RepID=A0A4C1XYD5_EUMVA|nr:hypothetical protein EVAR_43798_1 [Eumeta japonica]